MKKPIITLIKYHLFSAVHVFEHVNLALWMHRLSNFRQKMHFHCSRYIEANYETLFLFLFFARSQESFQFISLFNSFS